jgi:hypothetical protein
MFGSYHIFRWIYTKLSIAEVIVVNFKEKYNLLYADYRCLAVKKRLRVVSWLRLLVAGLSPRRLGFDPGQSMWDLWWTKWHWDRFFPENFGFLPSFHSTGAPLHGKTKQKLIIFITGLHNGPQGCGASVASAAGPSKKKSVYCHLLSDIGILGSSHNLGMGVGLSFFYVHAILYRQYVYNGPIPRPRNLSEC